MKCNCSAVMDHFEDAYDGRENKMGEYYWCPACGTLSFRASSLKYNDWDQAPKDRSKWINVNDRLPKASMQVWVCWGSHIGQVVRMDCIVQKEQGKMVKRFIYHGGISPWDILYWQPYYKPQPPKLENKIL